MMKAIGTEWLIEASGCDAYTLDAGLRTRPNLNRRCGDEEGRPWERKRFE